MDPSALFAKKLVLITGKGGIGKSLVSAALGQAAAARGAETLLVEAAASSQIAPLFGVDPGPHEKICIAPHLSAVNLTSTGNFREYVTKYLGQKVLYDRVFSHKVVQSFINTIPGFAEIMLLGRLFYTCELAETSRPDLVIFDSFASGHFLSLMTTPDAILDTRLGGPLTRETERVKEFLSDPERCAILYVTVPEELVVSETLDFLPQIAKKAPAPLAGVLVNRMPPSWEEWGAEALAGPAGRFLQARCERAHAALSELKRGLAALAKDGLKLALWTTPDLGFVDDPLPAGFGEAFLLDHGGGRR